MKSKIKKYTAGVNINKGELVYLKDDFVYPYQPAEPVAIKEIDREIKKILDRLAHWKYRSESSSVDYYISEAFTALKIHMNKIKKGAK